VLSGDQKKEKNVSAFNPRKHRVLQHATWRLCVALQKQKLKNSCGNMPIKNKTDPLVSLSTYSPQPVSQPTACLSTHSLSLNPQPVSQPTQPVSQPTACLSTHSLSLNPQPLSFIFILALSLSLNPQRTHLSSPSKNKIVQACREYFLCIILPIYIQIESVLLDKMCSFAH
jgi:hypothetical protein